VEKMRREGESAIGWNTNRRLKCGVWAHSRNGVASLRLGRRRLGSRITTDVGVAFSHNVASVPGPGQRKHGDRQGFPNSREELMEWGKTPRRKRPKAVAAVSRYREVVTEIVPELGKSPMEKHSRRRSRGSTKQQQQTRD